jgi:hypothetical protein
MYCTPVKRDHSKNLIGPTRWGRDVGRGAPGLTVVGGMERDLRLKLEFGAPLKRKAAPRDRPNLSPRAILTLTASLFIEPVQQLRRGDCPFRKMRVDSARGNVWILGQLRSGKRLSFRLGLKSFGDPCVSTLPRSLE